MLSPPLWLLSVFLEKDQRQYSKGSRNEHGRIGFRHGPACGFRGFPRDGDCSASEDGDDASQGGDPLGEHDRREKGRRNGGAVHGVGVLLQDEEFRVILDDHVGQYAQAQHAGPGDEELLFRGSFRVDEAGVHVPAHVHSHGEEERVGRGHDEGRDGRHADPPDDGGHPVGRQVDEGLGRVDVGIEGPGGDGGGGHEEVGGRASQHPADAALHGRFFVLRREEALVHVLVAHHVEEHREEEPQKLGEGNGTESEMSRRDVRRHPAPAPGHGDRHGHADEEADHHHAAAQKVGVGHRVQASE